MLCFYLNKVNIIFLTISTTLADDRLSKLTILFVHYSTMLLKFRNYMELQQYRELWLLAYFVTFIVLKHQKVYVCTELIDVRICLCRHQHALPNYMVRIKVLYMCICMNHVIFYIGVATDLYGLKNELNMLKQFKAMKLSGACYKRFLNQPFKTCIHMSRN